MIYRLLLGIAALLWLALSISLQSLSQPYELPLLRVQFSSIAAAAWLLTGVGLLVLAFRHLFRSRSANGNWIARYEMLSTYLNEGMLICNANGRVRWNNQAAEGLMMTGNVLPENLRNLFKRSQQTGQVAIQTLSLGEQGRFSVQAFPLDRQNFALICRPLQSAGPQNTFYESFIRRIVHDMRNPLAGIIGHAANLRQAATVEPDVWRKSASTIESEAQRLARLVDSMLFDARLAYVPLETQRFDLVDVLEEALYAHDEHAAQESKTLEMDAPQSPMRVEGDRDLLTRAFENLIDNSLKYSSEGGKLHIRLHDQPNTYVIQFADNGEGIPAEYLPDKIFEPLVRARSHGSGSGLGLSIARKIFEMHGGNITAQSRVGAGTTMTVRLPKPLIDGTEP